LLNRAAEKKPALLHPRLLLSSLPVQHACVSGLTAERQQSRAAKLMGPRKTFLVVTVMPNSSSQMIQR
jgi:hypothetical protein